ncbi:MAG: septum formation initiator family protein [Solirubrobacterales bacterium]|jgi:cell division protein FtsB|nr:septum formation initiator family protein [Solirubrobacterales bacterium]
MALLLVLLGIVSLYIGPLHSYWATRQEAQAKRNDVTQLQRENARLKQRRAALRSKGTLEKEARRLGMVRPGERPFSVSGLPKGP